uniref:Voltage-gated potassium channel n=1 Tax=Physalia physalis TaxID=168775 RepID=Q27S87_9CNID|nr:voltage-gated potassium channel [Physalia physalis]
MFVPMMQRRDVLGSEMDITNMAENKEFNRSLPPGCDFDGSSGYDPNDEIININVSGQLFQTYKKTLNRFPNSLLGDSERRNKFKNLSTGELFFDRYRPAFESILYYYQSDGIMARPPNIPIHVFIKELVFFDIGDSVIDQIQIENGLKEPTKTIELPSYLPFRIIWNFLEYPETSRPAKLFAFVSVFIIVISLVMFVMETLPSFAPVVIHLDNGTTLETPNENESWMFMVSTAVIAWFTSEFMLRLICCPSKIKFFTNLSNIIDLLSIVPYYVSFALSSTSKHQGYLAVLRVIRVLRVFKLSRHSRGLQILGDTLKASFHELLMLAFFLLIMILLFGSCVYYAEYQVEGTKFTSIPAASWWAIVTMTTVGYGDMYPTTLLGKLIGFVAVVCGVLTIALPVPVVVSNFEYFYTKERNRRKTEEVRKEHEKQLEERKSSSNMFRKMICRKSRKKERSGKNSIKLNGICEPENEEVSGQHISAV